MLRSRETFKTVSLTFKKIALSELSFVRFARFNCLQKPFLLVSWLRAFFCCEDLKVIASQSGLGRELTRAKHTFSNYRTGLFTTYCLESWNKRENRFSLNDTHICMTVFTTQINLIFHSIKSRTRYIAAKKGWKSPDNCTMSNNVNNIHF